MTLHNHRKVKELRGRTLHSPHPSTPYSTRDRLIEEVKEKMSTYKLTYFPLRARAELARFVFAQAGVKYEDVRIPDGTWKELKPCELVTQG